VDLLLTLILSCSVHLDDSLVEALSYKLSIGNQYFVGDLTTLNTYDGAKSATEARRIVDAIKAAGGRPAVGFMALPVDWAARFGRTPEDLFDGCTNIAIGTSMLSDFARLCTVRRARHRPGSRPRGHPPTAPVRACILRRLEREMNIHGIVEHVLPVVARLEAAPEDQNTEPPTSRAPLFPDGSDTSQDGRDWSSPRLFASSPTAPLSSIEPRSSSSPPASVSPSSGPIAGAVPLPGKRAAPVRVRAPRPKGP
jgi:hypothetical protein